MLSKQGPVNRLWTIAVAFGVILLVINYYFGIRIVLNQTVFSSEQHIHNVNAVIQSEDARERSMEHLNNLVSESSNTNFLMPNAGYLFRNKRLRIWYSGRCIDSKDEHSLTVQMCDPEIDQGWSLSGSRILRHDRSGKCVGYNSQDQHYSLKLNNCSEALPIFLTDDEKGEFHLKSVVESSELCVTPMATFENYTTSTMPCLDDPVGLKVCNESASRLILLNEELFQEDRKLLRKAVVPSDGSCEPSFKACGFNNRKPVELLPQDEVTHCDKIWECVTLAVKTARRPHLVLRLARSVRDHLGFDLPMIVYDDGPEQHSDEVLQQIAEFPMLRYIVSMNSDLGIAHGRNLAIMHVKTKYFFMLDDDMTFRDNTDLAKLVSVLDQTDASVVGAALPGNTKFTGYLHFGHFKKGGTKRRMGQYHGACTLVNQTIPNHPSCMRCDIVTNIFLARTKDILEIGGWDPELKLREHSDIFIRLKAAGLKVALCPDVQVNHARTAVKTWDEEFVLKRQRGGRRYKDLMINKWNLHSIFDRNAASNMIVDRDTGEIHYVDEPEKGLC